VLDFWQDAKCFSSKEQAMQRILTTRILAVAAAILVLTSSLGHAAERWRRGAFNKQAAIGAYGRAVYPKYYPAPLGSIHASQIQNIGIPPGDVGILGSGLTRNPW
jgi:hypothetical protein